ncbi:uncharacterized protein LOC114528883 [Dendronephthya gigantea]|uniref:uncharacterized protein LOC114528883 n=1 Tax=Dendronephthya gigantea TaxID=151771 RepID=UPI00106CF156|nr:uncharacterized protein LOC114528883 [Dendronephthya gigantea]
MNRFALFILLLNSCGVFMKITAYKRSCLEIRRSSPFARSGEYKILVGYNSLITVYCDMEEDGGGYTFIPRDAVKRWKFPGLIKQIFKQKSRVLLRIKRKDERQPFTMINQLSTYLREEFSVLMHTYSPGYARPVNYRLGDYIYLGILPESIARSRSVQGFRSNGKSVAFRNCDANPNAYFAFFPNHNRRPVNNYLRGNPIFERQGVAVHWRRTAVFKPWRKKMPSNYFFLTELHFGGCGTYTSSDRWYDAIGTAIGLR